LNAYNIQLQGMTTGIPTAPPPPVALTSASNNTAATQPTVAPAQSNNDRPSSIIVEVISYGAAAPGTGRQTPQKRGATEL
jgi:hypothetical protein